MRKFKTLKGLMKSVGKNRRWYRRDYPTDNLNFPPLCCSGKYDKY